MVEGTSSLPDVEKLLGKTPRIELFLKKEVSNFDSMAFDFLSFYQGKMSAEVIFNKYQTLIENVDDIRFFAGYLAGKAEKNSPYYRALIELVNRIFKEAPVAVRGEDGKWYKIAGVKE